MPEEQWFSRDVARNYERHLVPALFVPWGESLVHRAMPQAGEKVLDVGCGTGIVARLAAAHVGYHGRVVGVDINERMLDVARHLATPTAVLVEWETADVADLPFEDGEFDVLLCQQVLQFVPDAAAALQEMRRVLGYGGRLFLSVWRPLTQQPAYAALARVLTRHVGPEAGAAMEVPFAFGGGAGRLRDLATQADLRKAHVEIEVGSARFASVRDLVESEFGILPAGDQLDSKVREAIVADMERELAHYVDDDGLVAPLEAYVLSAKV